MAEQKSSSALAAPLHGAASMLRRVPGAGVVGRAAHGTLDKVGAVSPRGRRLAVYTGAGVLGVAGVVEWPVALTGAAVAWLTQPRPERPTDGAGQPTGQDTAVPGPARDTTALTSPTPDTPTPTPIATSRKSAKKRGTATRESAQETGAGEQIPQKRPTAAAAGRGKSSKSRASTGPLGPTARPDRTTL
ncbi:hypothetical protein ACH4UM_19410 [Streptomyces sp. NPDC020801]|uniref:hypothetical protein n=1 Tax=unclassified Streptomyces TaxID=2593676 RepID=UPI0037B24085